MFAETGKFGAGAADTLTMGLTSRLRQWGGYDDMVDRNSGWYTAGQVTGTVVGIGLGFGNPCALGAGFGTALRVINGVQAVGGVFNAAENFAAEKYGAAALDAVGVFGNIAQMMRACFAGETELLTPEGCKRIDQFKEGDLVLSRSEFDPHGPVEAKLVEEVFVRFAGIIHLHVGGKVIRTTAEHPFYVIGKDWLPAGRLEAGDLLLSHDGQTVAVEEVFDTGEFETVYNLRVADSHTYFVGSKSWDFTIWAHNASYSTAPSKSGYQKHHIGQDAALEGLTGYSYYSAPVTLLRGGSYLPGSAHYLANLAQFSINTTIRATGATTQSILQVVRTSRQTLATAGVSRADRRQLVLE